MYSTLLLTFFAFTRACGAQNVNETNMPMHTALNPQCDDCLDDEVVLAYIRITDEEKDLVYHQVWDFTSSYPTIIYIIGSSNSTVDFEWKGVTPLRIRSSSPILYSYTTILHNLIEYLDVDNFALFQYTQPYRNITLKHSKWRCTVIDIDDHVVLHINTTLNEEHNTTSGVINFQMMLHPYSARMTNYPRLFYTPQDTVVDVSLVNMTGTFKDPRARFALRYIIVSEDDAADVLYYDKHDTIDDEYTPGVFRMFSLLTPSSKTNFGGGYIQFRPVAFKEENRDMSSSVESDLWSFNKSEIPRNCLAERFYAHHNRRKLLVQEAIASFGEIGDGYYNQTKYIVWSYMVGFGTPPAEAPSAWMVVAMAATLGVQLGGVLLLGCGLACLLPATRPRRPARPARA